MEIKKANKLRKLQDKFLAHSKVGRYIEEHGDNYPLFGTASPSLNDLKRYVFPDYEYRIKEFLNEYD